MLPNKMKISERATNALRRFQGNTGLTVNIGARIAFFTSIERSYKFDPNNDIAEHSGRELDKHTWLGEHSATVEYLLKFTYPKFNRQQLYDAWVGHVEDGSKIIETHSSLESIVSKL